MIGVLIFLGCTVRVFVRLGGGDLNAVFGLLGMITGIGTGTFFIKKGFSLPEKEKTFNSKSYTYIMPVISAILFLLLILKPGFVSFSEKGIGSQHSPIILALIGGLIIGILTNYFDLGFNSGFRNLLSGKMENPQILFPVSIIVFLSDIEFCIEKFEHRICRSAGCSFFSALEFFRTVYCGMDRIFAAGVSAAAAGEISQRKFEFYIFYNRNVFGSRIST